MFRISIAKWMIDQNCRDHDGNGRDGANGLIKLKERGQGQVRAIAESQETSIVFGMPKAAISTHLSR